jgi:hypothetical protein
MMMPPKNAKKIEVCGVTFYALRQIIGYIGSGNWGSAQNFVEKHGWNLYNSKGAFIYGGKTGVVRESIKFRTFAEIKQYILDDDEKWIKKFADKEPEGIPFELYD